MPTHPQKRRFLLFDPVSTYTQKIKRLDPLAYWPLSEINGIDVVDESGNGYHGTYKNIAGVLDGVTLEQAGIGDGRGSVALDGLRGLADVYSASLIAAFNAQEMTMCIWAKVANASVWTDATIRRFFVMSVNSSNRILLQKNSTSNALIPNYVAGGTSKNVGNISFSSTSWFHVTLTASKSADQVRIYINGTQQGSTLTGLGTFTGTIPPTLAVIGADESVLNPTAVWNGNLAHVVIFPYALNVQQVAAVATIR